jgi:uncharacterized surface protein with fasciclin (FAS1) repeats
VFAACTKVISILSNAINAVCGGLQTAGLADVVADPDAVLTVLAPTDSAFAVIPPEDIKALLAHLPALTEVLTLRLSTSPLCLPEDPLQLITCLNLPRCRMIENPCIENMQQERISSLLCQLLFKIASCGVLGCNSCTLCS